MSTSPLPQSGQAPEMTADQLIHVGLRRHQEGDLRQAEAIYRNALRVNPQHPDALHLLGMAMMQSGRGDGAIELLRQAVDAADEVPAYYHTLATAYRQLGKTEEVVQTYERMCAVAPASVEAQTNLAAALGEARRPEEAVEAARRATELDPNHAPAHNNLANALRESGDPEAAAEAARKAIELKPDYADAYSNLAAALNQLAQHREAYKACQSALRLWMKEGDALPAYRRFGPRLPPKTELTQTYLNRAAILLALGNFERGWQEYEWRWLAKSHHTPRRKFAQPQWEGEDISGKTLLVHSEQGIGDVFQFIRYVPLIARRDVKVIVETYEDLASLISRVEGVEKVYLRGQAESVSPFDVHIPLMSLPLAFGTQLETIPRNVPYIKPDPERIASWSTRIKNESRDRYKVGVVWAGNANHSNDRNRSMPVSSLSPLITRFANVAWFSLQKGRAGDEQELRDQGVPLINLSHDIKDFDDTAAIMAQLDLILSVDTAAAHLAGAMRRNVWTMLPFAAEWRWLVDRKTSPWYPTMKLFRQSKRGDWNSVVEAVGAELAPTLKK
jgi:tetratricopeptide (TPR) repeat protein